jgi:hypothetical protein
MVSWSDSEGNPLFGDIAPMSTGGPKGIIWLNFIRNLGV